MRPSLDDLAAHRHGVVTRRTLLAAGWSPKAIRHAAESGRLHPVHTGVYAVGSPRLTPDGRAMAAALTAGPHGGLAAESAVDLWEMRESRTSYWRTITRSPGGRARPGIKVTRAPALRDDELTTLRAIPVTTPARSLLDMAARVQGRALVRALDQAEALRIFDLRALETVLAHHPRHRGAAALARALRALAPQPELTRSDRELAFLSIVDAHRLPRPLVNVPIGVFTVDFLFAVERVVVEVDAHPAHATAHGRGEDIRRDTALAGLGYLVLRYDGRQVLHDPTAVGAAVTRTLRDRRRPG